MPIKIAIVEDDVRYSNALRKILSSERDIKCVAQIFDGKNAVEELISAQPDIVLMDIRLPNILGFDIVSQLTTAMENMQFIMCTSCEDDDSIFASLKAGATGYMVKGDSMEKIIASVKEVYNGGAPMSIAVARRVLQYFHSERRFNEISLLTPAEKEVLKLLAKGLLYKEIADQKHVSIDTVKKHIGHIYRKLHVNNKIEAINKLHNM